MAATTLSAADALVRTADKAGEAVASSAMDKTFAEFQLPSDPAKVGAAYGKAAQGLYDSLGLGGALERSRDLTEGSATADAAALFKNRATTAELAKTPVTELDAEIERLSTQRWSILPAVLGRTDITDYGAKLKIAARANEIMDGEITRITNTRQSLVTAAENRAKDHVEELQATAALLDKQALAAQNDLSSRITLFQSGKATFDDIVQASLKVQELQDARRKASAGGNSMIGLGTGAGAFSPAEIASFGYFEKFGDFPGVDSTKIQLKQQLTQRYATWIQQGRPGSKLPVGPQPMGPPNLNGQMPVGKTIDVSDIFKTPAIARSAQLGMYTRTPGAESSSTPLPSPVDNGEFGDGFTPHP